MGERMPYSMLLIDSPSSRSRVPSLAHTPIQPVTGDVPVRLKIKKIKLHGSEKLASDSQADLKVLAARARETIAAGQTRLTVRTIRSTSAAAKRQLRMFGEYSARKRGNPHACSGIRWKSQPISNTSSAAADCSATNLPCVMFSSGDHRHYYADDFDSPSGRYSPNEEFTRTSLEASGFSSSDALRLFESGFVIFDRSGSCVRSVPLGSDPVDRLPNAHTTEAIRRVVASSVA